MTNIYNKTSNGARNRIIFCFFLIGAVFYTPWWIVAILAFTGAFLWPPYFEIFVFGILIDILYGASAFPLGGVYGIFGAIIIFFIASYVRKVVR